MNNAYRMRHTDTAPRYGNVHEYQCIYIGISYDAQVQCARIFINIYGKLSITFADDEFGEKTVSILLDGEESEMVFIDHPSIEMSVSTLRTSLTRIFLFTARYIASGYNHRSYTTYKEMRLYGVHMYRRFTLQTQNVHDFLPFDFFYVLSSILPAFSGKFVFQRQNKI